MSTPSRRPRTSSSSSTNSSGKPTPKHPRLQLTPSSATRIPEVAMPPVKPANDTGHKGGAKPVSMEDLMARFDALEASNEHVITTLGTNTEAFTNLSQQATEVLKSSNTATASVGALTAENNQLKLQLNVVMNRQLRMEREFTKLKSTVLDIQTRQMRENIVIRNLSENRGENPFRIVIDSFINDFKIPEEYVCTSQNPYGHIKIDIAHRIYGGGGPSPRPMVVKFENRYSKDEVMSYCRNLRNSNLSVTEQFPSEVRAKRAAQIPTLKENKINQKKVKMQVDTLYVDNKPVDPGFRKNPLPNSVTHMNADLPEPAKSLRITENGSAFIGYASKVASLSEANTALQQIQAEDGMGTVTHISYAYSITGGGSQLQGNDDDGEYGLSSQLQEVIKSVGVENVLVAVARWHEGPNIGYRRFELANKAATSSIEILVGETEAEQGGEEDMDEAEGQEKE